MSNASFDTDSPFGDEVAAGKMPIARMKVVTVDSAAGSRKMTCHLYDGTSEGTSTYKVYRRSDHAPGDEIWAAPSQGGAKDTAGNKYVWVEISGSGGAEFAQVVSAIGGAVGRYNGKLLLGGTPSETGALSASDFGAQSEDVVIWYSGDIGKSSHSLNAGAVVMGARRGKTAGGVSIFLSHGGAASLPTGTVTYQVYQMTSATVAGWDWVRAH